MKTNYDQSSTGTDIELSIMLDGDMARIYFDENFEAIKGMGHGYGSTSRHWYTDNCEVAVPNGVEDCIDWKAATADDCRAWLVERYCTGKYGAPIEDVEASVDEYYDGDWTEAARDTIAGGNAFQYDDGVELANAIGDDFAELGGYFTIKYNVAKIRGHCQGDYAEVLYDPAIWSGDFDPSDYFANLFYDAPVYARVTVDGEEHYLDERMDDQYGYDRDEMEKIVSELDLGQAATDWIIGELPQYPEYVG